MSSRESSTHEPRGKALALVGAGTLLVALSAYFSTQAWTCTRGEQCMGPFAGYFFLGGSRVSRRARRARRRCGVSVGRRLMAPDRRCWRRRMVRRRRCAHHRALWLKSG